MSFRERVIEQGIACGDLCRSIDKRRAVEFLIFVRGSDNYFARGNVKSAVNVLYFAVVGGYVGQNSVPVCKNEILSGIVYSVFADVNKGFNGVFIGFVYTLYKPLYPTARPDIVILDFKRRKLFCFVAVQRIFAEQRLTVVNLFKRSCSNSERSRSYGKRCAIGITYDIAVRGSNSVSRGVYYFADVGEPRNYIGSQ